MEKNIILSSMLVTEAMEFEEFLSRLKALEKCGFVESKRSGSTGIGKTLEDELGIQENNVPGPDFDRYELKARRRESTAPITLFTKSPDPKGSNRRLWNAYGYREGESKDGLVQTTLSEDSQDTIVEESISGLKVLRIAVIAGKENRAGIQPLLINSRISLSNPKGIEAYYNLNALRAKFEQKYKPLVLVLADYQVIDGVERFHYNEAFLLKGFGFDSFLQLLAEGKIEIHIRIGYYEDGRYHDHGTAFRTYEEHFPSCFREIHRIL